MGIGSQISRLSIGDQLDFSAFDMVYAGPGKARNLKRAAEHFVSYADEVRTAIDSGKVFLFTGNARLLLGKEYVIRAEGKEEKVKGIGYFPYTGVETGDVFISDVISQPLLEKNAEKTYGFINRTSYIEENPGPYLFRLLQGAGESNQPGEWEGNLCRNLFATWQLGPVLVKNPHLTREILSRLLPGQRLEYDDSLAVEAWKRTVEEFPSAAEK